MVSSSLGVRDVQRIVPAAINILTPKHVKLPDRLQNVAASQVCVILRAELENISLKDGIRRLPVGQMPVFSPPHI